MSNERLVFLDVDTQVDFMLSGGALYVPGAETIIPNLRRLMTYALEQHLLVISSADAHAINDASFSQWPPHCVVGTPGQKRIPETQWPAPLVIPNQRGSFQGPLPAAGQIIIEKTDYDVSSNPNFDSLVTALGPSRFVVFGVATEYCVRASALAVRDRGFTVGVVADAIRGIAEERHRRALQELAVKGVHLVTTDSVLADSNPQRS